MSRRAVGNGQPRSYREAHSALNGPLLTSGLVAPVAAEAGCLVLGIVLRQPWFFVVMAWLAVPAMIWAGLLYRNWPTGIWLDAAAIRIGAVSSPRAARRTPTVSHQSWALMTCPWSAVTGTRMVTDRAELRAFRDMPGYLTLTNRWSRRRGMDHCQIGVLAAPFMRAALVIEIDLAAVTAPPIRPARFYTNGTDGSFSHRVRPQLSPVWVVPTRRPAALRRALAAVSGAPGPDEPG